jgi:hypothetical protein
MWTYRVMSHCQVLLSSHGAAKKPSKRSSSNGTATLESIMRTIRSGGNKNKAEGNLGSVSPGVNHSTGREFYSHRQLAERESSLHENANGHVTKETIVPRHIDLDLGAWFFHRK